MGLFTLRNSQSCSKIGRSWAIDTFKFARVLVVLRQWKSTLQKAIRCRASYSSNSQNSNIGANRELEAFLFPLFLSFLSFIYILVLRCNNWPENAVHFALFDLIYMAIHEHFSKPYYSSQRILPSELYPKCSSLFQALSSLCQTYRS